MKRHCFGTLNATESLKKETRLGRADAEGQREVVRVVKE